MTFQTVVFNLKPASEESQMTNQELKEAAARFAKKFGVDGETFTTGESIDAIVVYFEGDTGRKVQIVLDRNTGAFLGGNGAPPKYSN